MDSQIAEIYGNKVRLRVCGLLRDGDRILMVNHAGLTTGAFWSPPGGGVEFGESSETALKREFLEETGLTVEIQAFRFACEVVKPPLHAVELFFDVQRVGGKLTTGKDPEIQIIREVQFLDFAEIGRLPANNKHGIFQVADTIQAFERLQGFYTL